MKAVSGLLLGLFVGLVLIACDAAQLGFVTPSPAPDALASRVAQAVAATLTAMPSSQPTAVPPATLPPGPLETLPGQRATATVFGGQATTAAVTTVTPGLPLPPPTLVISITGTPVTTTVTTVTATRASATTPVTPPAVRPGIYVTDIRLAPAKPSEKEDVWFYATFLNTLGIEQTYRWFIYIYKADHTDPFGQTSSDKRSDEQDVIPPGTSERKALNAWKIFGGDGACVDYWAKVYYFDLNSGAKTQLTDPNGGEFVKHFQVCPAVPPNGA